MPPIDVIQSGFLVNRLASGFALATLPASASAIHTDTDGLIAGEVAIPTGDGEIPAYRARPARGRDFPVVLVVQEIFGVHEHIKDVCRRLAKEGYLAVASEMYARQGDVSKIENIPDIVTNVVSKVPDAQVMSDLDAAAVWAVKEEGGNSSRLAISGFCWGGRATWLYAAHNPDLKAGAAWYGRMEGPVTPNTPKHPLDVAGSLKAPVLGLYGAQDTGIPLASVEKMRAALAAANSPSEIIVYPDAGHAFNADYRPSYHAPSAQDAWQKQLAWFRKYGV